MLLGFWESRAKPARIWLPMRVTGSSSKRASVSARRSNSKATSRFSVRVIISPLKVSRPAENDRLIDSSASRPWKAWESSSPAPSSIRAETRLASPSLPAGSSAAPPRNTRSRVMIGLLWSSTSQASIPPGLITRWTSMARAGRAAVRIRAGIRARIRIAARTRDRGFMSILPRGVMSVVIRLMGRLARAAAGRSPSGCPGTPRARRR